MIDYILCFPNKQIAEQFSISNGFAVFDNESKTISPLLEIDYSICEVGEHNGDGQYWVLFRDLVGIPIPAGGDQFIYWSSEWTVLDEDGNETAIPRPVNDPNVPNIWWA